MYFFAASRMDENQLSCMKALTFKALFRRWRAIESVPKKRMPNRCHVYANLMGAPGLKNTAYVSISLIRCNTLPVSNSRLGILFSHSHAFAVNRMSAYRLVNCSRVFLEAASGYGLVNPVQAMVRKLCRKRSMGKIIFCNNEQAGGVFIDTVDNAGPTLTADTGERVTAVIKQCVYKSTVRMSGGRMHDHAALLVYYNKVSVLINDIKRDVLCYKGNILQLREEHENLITGIAAIIFFKRLSVQAYKPLIKKFLNLASAELGHITHEESVDSFAALLSTNKSIKIFHYLNSARMSSRLKSSSNLAWGLGWAFIGG